MALAAMVLLAAAGAAVYKYKFAPKGEEKEVLQKIGNQETLVKKYDEIKQMEQKFTKEEKPDIGRLFSLGMAWKSQGDATQDKYFYQKALETYETGIKYYGKENVLFYWNAGKMAEYLLNYPLAETYYRKSIEISSPYNEPYEYLFDLYANKMKKTPDECIKVLNEGIEKTAGSASLVLKKCSYLRTISRTKDAIACYDILSQGYPDNQGYKDIVNELKALPQ